jgi:hypothetical protein
MFNKKVMVGLRNTTENREQLICGKSKGMARVLVLVHDMVTVTIGEYAGT